MPGRRVIATRLRTDRHGNGIGDDHALAQMTPPPGSSGRSDISVSVEGQGRRLILRARGTVDGRTIGVLHEMIDAATEIVGRPSLVELDLRETRVARREDLSRLVTLRERGIRVRQPWTDR
jgi:hypothetical protein